MSFELDVESVLLLACSRCTFDIDQRADIHALLREDLNWERVLFLAEKNYVLPLLCESLADWLVNIVPEAVAKRLTAQRSALKLRAALFCDELFRLAALFEEADISVLHYKGPICSDALYGNPFRRTYFDLDFLVKRQDLAQVCRMLREDGYQCNVELPANDQVYFEREQKEYAFMSGLVCLEPHWSVTANRFRFPIDYDGLWSRAVVHRLEQTDLPTFCPKDMLLILSVVGGKGQWKRLQMVCDIAQFYRSMDASIAVEVLADAQELGCERMLLLAAHLAETLLDAPIPDVISARAERDSKAIKKLSKRIVKRLFESQSTEGVLGHSPHIFSPLLFSMRERTRDRFHYLVRTTTTPTSAHMQRFQLPKWAFPAYRVIVPLHDFVLMPSVRAARSLAGRRCR